MEEALDKNRSAQLKMPKKFLGKSHLEYEMSRADSFFVDQMSAMSRQHNYDQYLDVMCIYWYWVTTICPRVSYNCPQTTPWKALRLRYSDYVWFSLWLHFSVLFIINIQSSSCLIPYLHLIITVLIPFTAFSIQYCVICFSSASFIVCRRTSMLPALFVCSYAYCIIILFRFALVILCFLASFSSFKSIYEGNLGCGSLKERKASGLIFCENTSSLYRTLFVSFLAVVVGECCNRHACVYTVHVFQHVFNTINVTYEWD